MHYKSSPNYRERPAGGELVNKAANATNGIVEAYVSVFGNVDSYKERVQYGAFTRSLGTRTPKVWLQHDSSRPIGIHLEGEEVKAGDSSLPPKLKANGGLWVKGHLNLDVKDGEETYSHLKFGSLSEFSFGFEIMKSEPASDGVVDLLDLELWEWSPVSIGANPLTQVERIKSLSFDEKTAIAGMLFPELSDHAAAYADMRQNAGKPISAARLALFKSVADGMEQNAKNQLACAKTLREILADAETQKAEGLTLAQRQQRLRLERANLI